MRYIIYLDDFLVLCGLISALTASFLINAIAGMFALAAAFFISAIYVGLAFQCFKKK